MCARQTSASRTMRIQSTCVRLSDKQDYSFICILIAHDIDVKPFKFVTNEGVGSSCNSTRWSAAHIVRKTSK